MRANPELQRIYAVKARLLVLQRMYAAKARSLTSTNPYFDQERRHYMAAFERIQSGIPVMDAALDNIRLGDNVVWQVSSLDNRFILYCVNN